MRDVVDAHFEVEADAAFIYNYTWILYHKILTYAFYKGSNLCGDPLK